jgi:deoxyribose-phosphate aldolase
MPAAKAPTSLRRLFDDIGTVDQVGIEERVAKYTTRSLKKKSKVFGLRLAVTMVDLTTLEGKDTPGKVASLCQKALTPHDIGDIPSTAAVCVYPSMVKHAKKHVGGTKVKIASVATAFPSGQVPLKTRLAEVRAAVSDGADEIDMVINRGAFLSGEFGLMQDEIAAVVEACGSSTLKVILDSKPTTTSAPPASWPCASSARTTSSKPALARPRRMPRLAITKSCWRPSAITSSPPASPSP